MNRCKAGLGMIMFKSYEQPLRCDLDLGHTGNHQTLQPCIRNEDVTDKSIKIFTTKGLDRVTLTWHNTEHD